MRTARDRPVPEARTAGENDPPEDAVARLGRAPPAGDSRAGPGVRE